MEALTVNHIQIYGMQRTGTNFLQELFRQNTNFKVTVNQVGWKHGVPWLNKITIKNQEVFKFVTSSTSLGIVIIKNPYMWYNSIKRWTNKLKKEFILEKEYNRFNMLYGSYKYLLEGNLENTFLNYATFIKYEELLKDEEAFLKTIHKKFPYFELKENIEIPKKVAQSNIFNSERRLFYIKQIPNISNDIKTRISKIIDWDLMKFYGYYI